MYSTLQCTLYINAVRTRTCYDITYNFAPFRVHMLQTVQSVDVRVVEYYEISPINQKQKSNIIRLAVSGDQLNVANLSKNESESALYSKTKCCSVEFRIENLSKHITLHLFYHLSTIFSQVYLVMLFHTLLIS